MRIPSTSRLADYALNAIAQAIRAGRWRPGDWLPGQRELAEELGISRPALREAVSALEMAGVLRSQPGKGVCVLAEPDAAGAETRQGAAVSSDASFQDLLQLRYALEPFVVGLVAQTIGPDELLRLQMNLMTLRDAVADGDVQAAVEADLEFHRLLVGFSTNPAFRSVIDQAAAAIADSRGRMDEQADDMEATVQEHALIVHAIRRHDSAAASQAMRDHLLAAGRRRGLSFATPFEA